MTVANATIERRRVATLPAATRVQPTPVLLVGNFLSSSVGTRCVCEELADRLVSGGWPVVTTSTRKARAARLADMLATVVLRRAQYQVAVVDVFSGPAFAWAESVCFALRAIGKPYVLTLRGGNLPSFAAAWPRRVRSLFSGAACVTSPSPYLAGALGRYRAGIRVLPNPIDVASYPFLHRVDLAPRLVWLRALHAIYNPMLIPRVVAELVVEFPAIRIEVFGPDKGDGSAEATQKLARELGVAERIVFAGSVPKREVPRALSRGDLFLNTASVDNTPVSVLEAMACGLCVVSTDVGGLPFLLEHGSDALMVPPDDPKAMAGAVRQLLRDRALAARVSLAARSVAERCDWSTFLPKWAAIVASAVARIED